MSLHNRYTDISRSIDRFRLRSAKVPQRRHRHDWLTCSVRDGSLFNVLSLERRRRRRRRRCDVFRGRNPFVLHYHILFFLLKMTLSSFFIRHSIRMKTNERRRWTRLFLIKEIASSRMKAKRLRSIIQGCASTLLLLLLLFHCPDWIKARITLHHPLRHPFKTDNRRTDRQTDVRRCFSCHLRTRQAIISSPSIHRNMCINKSKVKWLDQTADDQGCPTFDELRKANFLSLSLLSNLESIDILRRADSAVDKLPFPLMRFSVT